MFEEKIKELIAKTTKLKESEIILEKPKDNFGDYAFPCFSLAKIYKKNPVEIAKDLKNKMKPFDEIEHIEAVSGYLNFFINKEFMFEKILKEILKQKEDFGKGQKKGKIMTEFCHANTHKAFHIGHTRNIALGESISRILEKNGFEVIRVNYQGDVGMHIAKTLWGLQNLKKLKLKEPKEERGKWLGIVYATASKVSKENEKITEEINKINQKLYSGDKELTDLWKKTRQWSIDYFENIIYPDFGVKFKRFYFEKEVEKKGTEIAKSLLKKGIAKKSDGAIVMDLKKFGLDIFIILKSDETPLYGTKDLYLAELQNKEYNPNEILHIVGSEQNFYFKQLIKTLELVNPIIAKKEKHITYELVLDSTGRKFASREGIVVLYDDTIKKLTDLAEKEIKQRDSKLKEKELKIRARKIALGAIKYAMLSQSTNKPIVFDEKEIIRFEGDTGSYLLYSYARASSILRKMGKEKQNKTFKIAKLNEQEIKLSKALMEFPEIVQKAGTELNPSIVANYAYNLAKTFNEFYHACQVIGSEESTQRIALVSTSKIVLKEALNLLGIEALEEM